LSYLPASKKVTASDMNEIKNSVNDLYDEVDELAVDVAQMQGLNTVVFTPSNYILPVKPIGSTVIVTNTSADAIVIIGQINGETNFVLFENESLSVAFDGTEWRAI